MPGGWFTISVLLDPAGDRDRGGGAHRPTHHADQPRRRVRPVRRARAERR